MSTELRLVAASGELLPAGQTDADARTVYDFLRNASASGASFHAINTLHLTLQDPQLQSKWYSLGNSHLEALQNAGRRFLTDAWPNATIVPQAFIDVGQRADAYAPQLESALGSHHLDTAAAILDAYADDLGRAKKKIGGYRGDLELLWTAASVNMLALTLGPASIFAMIADDAGKVAELVAQVAAAKKRIEDRIQEIVEQHAMHAAKLTAFILVIGQLKDGKLVKEWTKAFAVMMAVGTLPDLHKEEFLRDFNEINEKLTQIGRLGRDVFGLISLGSAIKSTSDSGPGLSLAPVEGVLSSSRDRLKAAADRLRQTKDAGAVREQFAAELQHTRRLHELAKHFQLEVVEAQKPPEFVSVG